VPKSYRPIGAFQICQPSQKVASLALWVTKIWWKYKGMRRPSLPLILSLIVLTRQLKTALAVICLRSSMRVRDSPAVVSRRCWHGTANVTDTGTRWKHNTSAACRGTHKNYTNERHLTSNALHRIVVIAWCLKWNTIITSKMMMIMITSKIQKNDQNVGYWFSLVFVVWKYVSRFRPTLTETLTKTEFDNIRLWQTGRSTFWTDTDNTSRHNACRYWNKYHTHVTIQNVSINRAGLFAIKH